jgi:precorrin-6B methylase 1
MVIPADIEKALTAIERLIREISEALVTGDPLILALASTQLRQASVELSQMLPRFDSITLKNPSLKLRLTQIAINLASRRESMLRQSGLVERALHTLVPASQTTTYSKAAGLYGAPGKSSGTFNFIAT